MQYGGFGVPATVSSGYSKVVPTYSSYVSPGFGKGGFGKGGFGKSFAKPFAKPVGKPFGKVGKSFGKVPGFPYSKSSGYQSKIPSTTVVTGPSVI